ncbi:MAG: twitching motility protein PilT [Anaerolineae bacterium SM23_ 63]|nr:MAG: twitching motility protein PilT [Anaerolineae bacterium SM23_ 63]HEY46384.1 Mut7-C ubiquitin/RNAse domain-containing protein [Anaerolineae bacterium]
MSEAIFRFYSELNDFLPLDRRQVLFTYAFSGRPAIKDTIEALGVPHTEVDLILANGVSVDFGYRLRDGDQISVYPVFESMDISPLLHLRPKPLREVCFVVDTHLGRLAGYLRMLGFDTLYRNDFADDELARISSHQSRILLTKDRGLLKRSKVTHGYFVREIHPRAQLTEVLRRFDLVGLIIPFQRCIRCNGMLTPVDKEEIIDQLQPETRQYYDEYRRCEDCARIYWRGSHYQRMQQLIAQVLEEVKG